MTISDEDLKEIKSCIYHDLAEMVRRADDTYSYPSMRHAPEEFVAQFLAELRSWAKVGGDPDVEEQA